MEYDPLILIAFIGGVLLGLLGTFLWILGWKKQREQLWARERDLERKQEEIARRDIQAAADRLVRDKEREWSEAERQLQSKRELVDERGRSLDEMEKRLQREEEEMNLRSDNVRKLQILYRKKLERTAHFDQEQARQMLREEVRGECEEELRQLRDELLDKTEGDLRKEAQNKLLAAMQRLTTKPMNDATATLVNLPSEDMKGRIIGREGRNIKSFEAMTGVTLMIDESPGAVLISSFDPMRREIARIALEGLVADGRIHPANIEEFVHRAEEEVLNEVASHGQEAVERLQLSGVSKELLTLVGKMKYRYSFTQNAFDHSIEVAHLSAMLAAELGLDPLPAKRAGLFHDIGKVMEEDFAGSHAIVGAEALRRFNEDERVINAVAAHHEEVPPTSPYAPLLMIADTLSASRPGARMEVQGAYLERLKNLESIALEFPGVKEAYAIQAGREVRVIVEPESVTDREARTLGRAIRQKVEDQLQYPGTIKITVIREQRFVETAK